jgi:hypothetical protein
LRLLTEAEEHGARCRADLIERVAARQGATGSKVLAVDAASLVGPVRDFLRQWELSDGPKMQVAFASTLKRGVRARQAELREWHAASVEWLGEDFDKQALVEELRELLSEAKQLALVPVETIDAIRPLLTQFRDAAVAEALKNAQYGIRDSADGVTLVALAQHDGKVAELVRHLGVRVRDMFARIESGIDSRLRASNAGLVHEMVAQVAAELAAINSALGEYSEVKRHEG